MFFLFLFQRGAFQFAIRCCISIQLAISTVDLVSVSAFPAATSSIRFLLLDETCDADCEQCGTVGQIKSLFSTDAVVITQAVVAVLCVLLSPKTRVLCCSSLSMRSDPSWFPWFTFVMFLDSRSVFVSVWFWYFHSHPTCCYLWTSSRLSSCYTRLCSVHVFYC